MTIVPPAGTQMDHMGGDCEVQTLFGSLHHLPKAKGTGESIKDERCHHCSSMNLFHLEFLVFEETVKRTVVASKEVQGGHPDAQTNIEYCLHCYDLGDYEWRIPYLVAETTCHHSTILELILRSLKVLSSLHITFFHYSGIQSWYFFANASLLFFILSTSRGFLATQRQGSLRSFWRRC